MRKLKDMTASKAWIKVDDEEFLRCRIYDLLSIEDGKVEVIAIITGVSKRDVDLRMLDGAPSRGLARPSVKTIECSVLGSVINGTFEQRLDNFPYMGAEVSNVCKRQLDKMLLFSVKHPFSFGTYVGYGTPALIDGNKFFQRHSCIVGGAGCGKSETVTKIIEEAVNNTNCNIIIFDMHGEYSNLSYVDSMKPGKAAQEGQEHLSEFIGRIMSGGKPVKDIDLSGVSHGVAVRMIGAIAKCIYDMQAVHKGVRPMTFVCDDAHEYLSAGPQLSTQHRGVIEVFENIAKEGRKYGVTLLMAAQRPSELSVAIMEQCANYIIMKLNHGGDKAAMKGLVPGCDVAEAAQMFSPGDCLVIGDACPLPLKIHVEQAREQSRSKPVDVWGEWQKARTQVSYYPCWHSAKVEM